ncbi:hypothetical protein MMC13_002654 [Lambiella insularis]|nr:hypothetical protein [Lambiella insularis]
MTSTNPFISTTKSSDSSLRALLHPLVLLAISDYITRHTLRQQTQPIVGALLGQQNGREVSLEHAYEVKLLHADGLASGWTLDHVWFKERLQQYKDVHKDPALDFVGWWTTCPPSGPAEEMVEMQKVMVEHYSESPLLLAFHPASVLSGEGAGGKLPLTIYESVWESGSAEQGKEMQIDGEEGLELRFRELSYEVVTGEAEMISVDFVARGGGNATAVDSSVRKNGKTPAAQSPLGERSDANGKGKESVSGNGAAKAEDQSGLTAEEEELIASLTTRANATRMLQSRISALKSYLQHLPPCYLTTTSSPPSPQPHENEHIPLSHPLLRSILALTARLPLLTPADDAAFRHESQAERSDVALVALLGGLGRSVQDAKALGATFAAVESGKLGSRTGLRSLGMGMGMGIGGGGEEPMAVDEDGRTVW